MKRLVAIATLAAFLIFNPLTAIVAEAHRYPHQRPIKVHHREYHRHSHHKYPRHYGHRHRSSNRDVIGGILIGTVIGAVIANNNNKRCPDCERNY